VTQTPVRKLAVLLHADIAGSTSLVQKNETLAHERIQDTFRQISETISRHSGIAHEIRGDALVAEFSRASDAITAALEFQAINTKHNEGLTDDVRPELRVGVAMGEVVIADNTVTGEGIVMAQRLEQLAIPGGVCVQGAAYETMPKRLPFNFENLGEHDLKGFDEPVKVYAVRKESPITTAESGASPLADTSVACLPDKPSIAVLPFDNLSGDPQQEYIAEGMAEEILTALASIPDLFVIARNSSFIYKGRGLRVDIIGQELGVQYVLEGSVHQSGKRVRITAQLIEAKSGKHLWAERYDRELDDIFALQDEIAREVTIALQIKLEFGEALVTYQGGTRNHHAWQLCLKGIENYHQISRAGNAESRRLLEEAVSLDAEYEGAMAMLGWANYSALRWDLVDEADNAACLNRLKEMIGNLLARNPEHGDGHFLTCALRVLEFDYDSAIEAGVRAVAAKPNDPNAHAYLAGIYAGAGRLADALPRIKYALRLSPHYGTWMLSPLLVISYQSGKHNDAITYARSSVERAPDSIPFYSRLVALLGATGRIEEGKAALARLHELDLNFSVTRFKKMEQHTDSKITEEWCEGLRAVGVPE
jgi:adenylate cyclase